MAGATGVITPEKLRRGLGPNSPRRGLGPASQRSATLSECRDETISSNCSRVLQWRKDMMHVQNADVQRALNELQRERSALNDLRAQAAVTEELAEAAAELQASSARVSQQIRSSAEAAAARVAAATEMMERLNADKRAREKELCEAEAEYEAERREFETRQKEIETLFSLYRERLGLMITRAAPSVARVSFLLLDQQDPTRECSFKLGLADSISYSIFDCQPSIPSSVTDSLLVHLNRDPANPSALPAFICSMRRVFKKAIGRRRSRGGE
eukprot:TRINITY_DN33798_c0_g1_i1.p1 TRINITY_DN33798_c0_g1~~TRINITY_DN33798_c0_g1_i1.p1  ORF type:complete len:271 (+),score=55.30 TRINITY_DN33798_c0_g1_i1:71-883(+)